MFFVSLGSVIGQSDEIIETVARGTCECAEKRKIEGSYEQMQLTLVECMTKGIALLSDRDQKKLDYTDEDKMRAFGERVGAKMAGFCPKSIIALSKMYLEKEVEETDAHTNVSPDDDVPPPPPMQELPTERFMLSGKITQVIEGEFVTLMVTKADGTATKVIWMEHFPYDSKYTDNPQLLLNKEVTIAYTAVEVYQPKSKEYVTMKVISTLTEK